MWGGGGKCFVSAGWENRNNEEINKQLSGFKNRKCTWDKQRAMAGYESVYRKNSTGKMLLEHWESIIRECGCLISTWKTFYYVTGRNDKICFAFPENGVGTYGKIYLISRDSFVFFHFYFFAVYEFVFKFLCVFPTNNVVTVGKSNKVY